MAERCEPGRGEQLLGVVSRRRRKRSLEGSEGLDVWKGQVELHGTGIGLPWVWARGGGGGGLGGQWHGRKIRSVWEIYR